MAFLPDVCPAKEQSLCPMQRLRSGFSDSWGWQLPDLLGMASQAAGSNGTHVRQAARPVEVDESFFGSLEAGVRGRETETKSKVAIAVERRISAGRARMRRMRTSALRPCWGSQRT
jgi:hypothetical protein